MRAEEAEVIRAAGIGDDAPVDAAHAVEEDDRPGIARRVAAGSRGRMAVQRADSTAISTGTVGGDSAVGHRQRARLIAGPGVEA